MWEDDQKCYVLKIAKRMVKTNQDIIGEQCIRNDDGVLAVSDEDKKIAWKIHYNPIKSDYITRSCSGRMGSYHYCKLNIRGKAIL